MPQSRKQVGGSSRDYQKLWSKLTRVMIAPSMHSISNESRPPTRGGGRTARSFGNDAFIKAWTMPRNQTKVATSSPQRPSRRHRKGGFIRDGSVQHFPTAGTVGGDHLE